MVQAKEKTFISVEEFGDMDSKNICILDCSIATFEEEDRMFS